MNKRDIALAFLLAFVGSPSAAAETADGEERKSRIEGMLIGSLIGDAAGGRLSSKTQTRSEIGCRPPANGLAIANSIAGRSRAWRSNFATRRPERLAAIPQSRQVGLTTNRGSRLAVSLPFTVI